MKIFSKTTSKSPCYDFNPIYKQEDILFFDIETTGFSAETTVLYLIGCAYYKDNCWNTIQWFADNNKSESNMLESFFDFIKDYKVLIHYNGDGFDIPYLCRKCKQYGFDYNFDSIESLDIYKRIRPYKKFLKVDNLKQKTIEQFLDIHRVDLYSGGELIQVYGDFLRCKHEGDNRQEEFLHLLLIHNEEDILGMLDVISILNYSDLFGKDIEVTSAKLQSDELILSISTSANLPNRISYGNDSVYFSAFGANATLKIALYKNELKFFYDNYKDYYYLPKEDTAIHKSVAFYVDKDFRTKAKAATCYSKKTGSFVPQFQDIANPYFKIDYFDKTSYVETTSEFLHDKVTLNHYAKHLLENM